jgi:hypothetical protein
MGEEPHARIATSAFDVPREVAYLDAASWSPLPKAVQAAGHAGVARKG